MLCAQFRSCLYWAHCYCLVLSCLVVIFDFITLMRYCGGSLAAIPHLYALVKRIFDNLRLLTQCFRIIQCKNRSDKIDINSLWSGKVCQQNAQHMPIQSELAPVMRVVGCFSRWFSLLNILSKIEFFEIYRSSLHKIHQNVCCQSVNQASLEVLTNLKWKWISRRLRNFFCTKKNTQMEIDFALIPFKYIASSQMTKFHGSEFEVVFFNSFSYLSTTHSENKLKW